MIYTINIPSYKETNDTYNNIARHATPRKNALFQTAAGRCTDINVNFFIVSNTVFTLCKLDGIFVSGESVMRLKIYHCRRIIAVRHIALKSTSIRRRYRQYSIITAHSSVHCK